MLPGEDDLYVEFFDSNLMVMVRVGFHDLVPLVASLLIIRVLPESRVSPSLLRWRW